MLQKRDKNQSLVKVVLSRIRNPSKSPFAKGDFQFFPLEKGRGRGDFWTNGTCENQFTTVKLTLTLPWKNYLTSFRVFYEVDHAEKAVSILAIGVKEGNQLFIGGQEFEL